MSSSSEHINMNAGQTFPGMSATKEE